MADDVYQLSKENQLIYNLQNNESKTLVVFLYESRVAKEQLTNIQNLHKNFSDAGYSTLTVEGDFQKLLDDNGIYHMKRFMDKIESESYCDNYILCGFSRGGTFALKYAEVNRKQCIGVMMLPGYYLPVKPLDKLHIYSRIGSKDTLAKYKERLYSAISKQKGILDSGIVESAGRTFGADWKSVRKWLEKIKSKAEKQKPDKSYLALNFMNVQAHGYSRYPVKLELKKVIGQIKSKMPPYWQFLKWEARHEGFIDGLNKSKSVTDLFTLADACRKAKLYECQEYVYRQILHARSDGWLKDSDYKKALNLWLPLNENRESPGEYILPLQGEIFVIVDRTKHHKLKHWAAEAFDFVCLKNGKPFKGNGRELSDHYIWERPIVAVADGEIISANDSHPDVKVGMNGGFHNANHILLNMDNGVCADYGHLKQGSLKVKVGQKVKKGEILALVGNSGASGSPHLHFTLVDIDGFSYKGRFNYIEKKGSLKLDKKLSFINEGSTIINNYN